MKQHTKRLFLLIAFILAGILYSCQFEEEHNHKNENKRFITEQKNFNDLLKDKNMASIVTKLAKKKSLHISNTTGRVITSEANGFSIDTDYSIYIEDTQSTNKSYTFRVNRPSETNPNILENLVVSFPNTTHFSLTLVKYLLNNEELNKLNKGIYTDLSNNIISSNPINDPVLANELSNKIYYIQVGNCTVIIECICTYGNHEGGAWGNSSCQGHHEQIIGYSCNDGGGGLGSYTGLPPLAGEGSTSSGATTTGSSSSTHGSVTPNTIITAPVPCPSCIEDPCEKLQSLKENKVKESINFLKPKVHTKIESGFVIKYGMNFSGNLEYTTEFFPGDQKNEVQLYSGVTVRGQAHNHPKDGMAIPSWADVQTLLSIENNNNTTNDGTAFSIAVVPNAPYPNNTALEPTIYCLTINNLALLQTKINADLDNLEYVGMDFLKKRDLLLLKQEQAFKSIQTSIVGLEKKFLEYFQDYGINLSKFNPVTQKWEVLTLQNKYQAFSPNANNTIIPTPCN